MLSAPDYRPDIVKTAPIVSELRRRNIDFFLVHTKQHYDVKMDSIFLEQLDLGPFHTLPQEVTGGDKRVRTVYQHTTKLLKRRQPKAVVVYGDTISAVAAGQAAKGLGLELIHVEAGLRCGDLTLPEEVGRILLDGMADVLFAPTDLQKKNLFDEGTYDGVFVTGNTIADSVQWGLEKLKQVSLGFKGPEKYVLLTTHRVENVDDPMRFSRLMKYIETLQGVIKLPIIWPVHPRVRTRQNLEGKSGIQFVDPMGFLEFLDAERKASLVLTDSGGVQEETMLLGVPCVTLRRSTERPETVECGANIVIDIGKVEEAEFLVQVMRHYQKPRTWKNPYGDKVASRIVDVLVNEGFM